MMRDLLKKAGFKNVSSSRADCPRCKGHAGTVSYSERKQVFNCHRCHWGGGARSLEKSLGLPVTPETPEALEIRLREERRERWLNEKYTALAKEEYRSARRAELAKKVLAIYPDCAPAWNALAIWYHKRRRLESTLLLLGCNSGRAQLLAKAGIQ
jgi:hypothetical protein